MMLTITIMIFIVTSMTVKFAAVQSRNQEEAKGKLDLNCFRILKQIIQFAHLISQRFYFSLSS